MDSKALDGWVGSLGAELKSSLVPSYKGRCGSRHSPTRPQFAFQQNGGRRRVLSHGVTEVQQCDEVVKRLLSKPEMISGSEWFIGMIYSGGFSPFNIFQLASWNTEVC